MSEGPKAGRRVTVGCAMVAVATFAVVMYVFLFSPMPRFRRAANRMTVAMDRLEASRPPDVAAGDWIRAIDAVRTVCANVCAGPSYVPNDEFERFDAELEQRLRGRVDLDTLDWIVARLGRTGAHGKSYMNRTGKGHYTLGSQAVRALRSGGLGKTEGVPQLSD